MTVYYHVTLDLYSLYSKEKSIFRVYPVTSFQALDSEDNLKPFFYKTRKQAETVRTRLQKVQDSKSKVQDDKKTKSPIS